MNKKVFALLAVACLISTCTPDSASQEQEQEQGQQEVPDQKEGPKPDPDNLEPFTFSVSGAPENNIFTGNPTYTLSLTNPNDVATTAEIKVTITSDLGKKAATIEVNKEVAAKGTATVTLAPEGEIAPGFYTVTGKVGRKNFLSAVKIGVSPDRIVYDMSDLQADFNSYWDSVLDELGVIDMSPVLTEVTSHSSSARKVYLVELKSISNGPDQEPETIAGYFVKPTSGFNHPVIMHYEGYDTQPPWGDIPKMYAPYGGSDDKYAEFYVSTRGQMINARSHTLRDDGLPNDYANTYGEWFKYQFGQKDGYYYRGAFMDAVQCIRFMAAQDTDDGQPLCDMDHVFAIGMSQGGALSYAAAALSPYPLKAIAAGVAFLGDFREYFKIAPSGFAQFATEAKGSMTTDEMYTFLSYYDTKNLATRIPETTAVIANIGLLDTTCPPRTNQAPFNTVRTTDKKMYYYKNMGHAVPEDWESLYKSFFESHLE